MLRILYMLVACLLFAASLAMATAQAASVDGQARKGYGRLNFNFDAEAQLRANVDGNTATLSFDTPLNQSASSIRAALPTYVKEATLSADKKTLVLTLANDYRIRQFTSGNRVGLDFIGEGGEAHEQETAALTSTKESPEKNILSTKKPTATKEPKKEKKPAEKKQEAQKPAIPATPAAAEPPAEPLLSTKPVEHAKAEPPSQPQPEAHSTKPETPAEESAVLTTKEPEAKPAPQPIAQPAKETAEATKPAEPSTSAAAAPAASKPFLVTARSGTGETTLNFPWPSRTATAIYKRGHNIWVVFSNYKNVQTGMIQPLLPKQVSSVTQYAQDGYTVLRIATDGTLNAKASATEKGYGWDLTFSQSSAKPTLEVAIAPDSLEGGMRLILSIFDVAPALTFYDPVIGDRMMVVPAYESGRGVSIARTFPEFSVLATAQGVAVASKHPGIELTQTRGGTIIGSKDGLNLSEHLPLLNASKAPVPGLATNSGVMMPYEQWYVPPEQFLDTLFERIAAVTHATKATKADSLMELLKLYLAYGMAPEAGGVLEQIRAEFPQYYINNKLAMLRGVTHVLMNHMDLAAVELSARELVDHEESLLWRQVVMLYTLPLSTAEAVSQQTVTSDSVHNAPHLAPSTPAEQAAAVAAVTATDSGFQYLKFSRPYIRFYPPRIRQRLAVIAADAYLANQQEEKALAVYDTLLRDNLLGPLIEEAEFVQAMVAQAKSETDHALEMLDRLSKQPNNLRVQARARHAATMLRYHKGMQKAEETAEAIESARFIWRGDLIERHMLKDLIDVYTDTKRYDEVLRTKKSLLEGYPNDPETLTIAGDMGDLFQRIFLEGLADEMTPLQALSLFYEFRELTPLGENGDKIIQNLADRLAAMDLLDRATQLLEHQVKFRSTGEARSRIGARLALLYLLNKQPQEALKVLEVTNFGENGKELQTQRRQLTADSLTKLDKHEEALGVLFSDTTPEGNLLRLDILWAMKDWPNVVNHAEDILGARANLTEPLNLKETEVLLKLALAYNFEGDYTQLRFLRDYYSGLIPDTAYKQIFDFITNDTNPLDPEDYSAVAGQISRTEGFLGLFKEKIAAGKLSEAVR